MEMHPTVPEATQLEPKSRREFLGQLATTAAILASAGCANQLGAATAVATAATPAPAAGPTTSPAPASAAVAARGHRNAPDKWDDSWTTRLTAPHKAVFDCAHVEDGEAVGHTYTWMQGLHDALGVPNDQMHAVLVIRHAAIAMALNDAMWAKYELGKTNKVKDGKHWATRNPYLTQGPDRKPRPGDQPDYTLSWLARHNHTLLGCDRALQGCSYEIADRTKTEHAAVYQELAANLIPGLILQPSGIYAAIRAQEAGCSFFKST